MRENAKILWQEHTCLLEEEKGSVYDWDKARTGEWQETLSERQGGVWPTLTYKNKLKMGKRPNCKN